MEDLKTYKTTFYMCGCGFETILPVNASRHKKISCGSEMKHESREFVLKEDVKKIVGNTQPINIVAGDLVSRDKINYIDNKQITINLMIPDGETRHVIYKALKSDQFQKDLNGEFQPENIPALIFRHTNGRGVTRPEGKQAIHVEDDKVIEKDFGGKVVKTTVNKYTKKFIDDATTVIERNTDLIKPRFAKELVEDLKTENLPGHKKNERISGAEALKNYAAGSHVVYKYPTETKGFIDRAVDAVKKEIRHANG